MSLDTVELDDLEDFFLVGSLVGVALPLTVAP